MLSAGLVRRLAGDEQIARFVFDARERASVDMGARHEDVMVGVWLSHLVGRDPSLDVEAALAAHGATVSNKGERLTRVQTTLDRIRELALLGTCSRAALSGSVARALLASAGRAAVVLRSHGARARGMD